MQDLRQLVYQQNLLLMELRDVLKPQQQLGFGASPRPVYLYANRSNGGLWYRLSEDSDRKPIILEHTALTGYLEKVEIKQTERRGKDVSKLHIHIKADRAYIIESGFDASFSRSMISAIATLTPEQVRQPVTIEVQPGDTDEVLFGRLYAGSESVYAPYGENPDWQRLTQAAIDAVDSAKGNSSGFVSESHHEDRSIFDETVLRLRMLLEFTGHQFTEVEQIASKNKINIDRLTPEQYLKLRDILLADYGYRQGVFETKKQAWDNYRKTIAHAETNGVEAQDDVEAIQLWKDTIEALKSKSKPELATAGAASESEDF